MDAETSPTSRVVAAVPKRGARYATIVARTGMARPQVDAGLLGALRASLLTKLTDGRYIRPCDVPVLVCEGEDAPPTTRVHRYPENAIRKRRQARDARYLEMLRFIADGGTVAGLARKHKVSLKLAARRLRDAQGWDRAGRPTVWNHRERSS